MTVAVGVLARAPSAAGKTRLAPHLSPERLLTLRRAVLTDTLRALESIPDLTIFFTPDDAAEEIASLAGMSRRRVAQGAGDLGARMLRALQYLLRVSDTVHDPGRCLTPDGTEAAIEGAILIGSDIPLLTADHIREAAEQLAPRNATAVAERSLVLGPADDGGYYLIGMTAPHAQLFEGIEWGTESVLTDTLRAADRMNLHPHLIRSTYDIDAIDDLLRCERDLKWLPSAVCQDLRRWFAAA